MEVFNEVPFLPLGQSFGKTAHRRDIEGIVKNVVTFWNMRRT
jgi:hypothetical protein